MSDNLFKVCYVDKTTYDGEQIDKYFKNVRMTRSQVELWEVLRRNNFNQTSTARDRGVTRQAISKSYVAIKNKVYKYMRQNNIEIEEAPHKYINLVAISEWYKTGIYSAMELSRIFKCSYHMLLDYFKKHNIKSPSAERYHIRYTVDDVKKEFLKENYKLITDTYSHQNDILEYICPYGHKGETTFHYWKHNKQRCLECNEREYGGGNYTIVRAERMRDLWLDKTGYVYLVKLVGRGESFCKVGISVNPQNRFYNFPYHVDVVNILEITLYEACYLEDSLLNRFAEHSYQPLKEFGGHTECFNLNVIDEIQEYLQKRQVRARIL